MADPTVTITYDPPRASGNRRGWAKTVHRIEPTFPGAAAFVGEYLPAGDIDLPLGQLVMQVAPHGPTGTIAELATLLRVTEAGLVAYSPAYDWPDRTGTFLRAVAEHLRLGASPVPLRRTTRLEGLADPFGDTDALAAAESAAEPGTGAEALPSPSMAEAPAWPEESPSPWPAIRAALAEQEKRTFELADTFGRDLSKAQEQLRQRLTVIATEVQS